jgi:hypothetical protein
VVIDFSEADVLVGEQAQSLDGGFDACRARRDPFEQLPKLLLVDGCAS